MCLTKDYTLAGDFSQTKMAAKLLIGLTTVAGVRSQTKIPSFRRRLEAFTPFTFDWMDLTTSDDWINLKQVIDHDGSGLIETNELQHFLKALKPEDTTFCDDYLYMDDIVYEYIDYGRLGHDDNSGGLEFKDLRFLVRKEQVIQDAFDNVDVDISDGIDDPEIRKVQAIFDAYIEKLPGKKIPEPTEKELNEVRAKREQEALELQEAQEAAAAEAESLENYIKELQNGAEGTTQKETATAEETAQETPQPTGEEVNATDETGSNLTEAATGANDNNDVFPVIKIPEDNDNGNPLGDAGEGTDAAADAADKVGDSINWDFIWSMVGVGSAVILFMIAYLVWYACIKKNPPREDFHDAAGTPAWRGLSKTPNQNDYEIEQHHERQRQRQRDLQRGIDYSRRGSNGYNNRRLASQPFEELAAQVGLECPTHRQLAEPVAQPEPDLLDQLLSVDGIEYYFGFSCFMQLVWIGLGYYLYKRCSRSRTQAKRDALLS